MDINFFLTPTGIAINSLSHKPFASNFALGSSADQCFGDLDTTFVLVREILISGASISLPELEKIAHGVGIYKLE